jgi:hypothetical protein
MTLLFLHSYRAMFMKKIEGVANFESKFLTFEGGQVCVRFDFGGFYEWYLHNDDSFSLIDVSVSKELEESFQIYEA